MTPLSVAALFRPLPPFEQALLKLCVVGGLDQPASPDADSVPLLIEWMNEAATRRAMIPHPALLVRGLREIDGDIPIDLRRRLDAAAMREETRSRIAARQAAELDAMLDREGIERAPIRGWHFAQNYYPDPLARHSHAIRWLVPDRSMLARAAELIAGQGWADRARDDLLAPHKLILSGPNRITVELHGRPFAWTGPSFPITDVASPEFTAVELIAAAFVEPQARLGLWMVDMVQLLRKRRPDPSLFAEAATACGCAGSAALALARVADLTGAEDGEVRAALQAMLAALTRSGTTRDGRAARALLRIQTMAETPRRRLLIDALRRPDLVLKSQMLRRDRIARAERTTRLRAELRDRQSANRG